MAIQSFRLVMRCKRCQWNLTAPQSICKRCGIAPAYIIKREIDSEISYICKTCNNSITHSQIPQHCIQCGSLAYDWWDYDGSNWLAPNLTLKRDIKGIWLIGEFEGDFVGTLSNTGIPNVLAVKENYHRDYDIQIARGHLINYKFTDRRPNLPIKADPKPIRQDFSNSILVKDLNSEEYFPANLADLVIYDWQRISEKEFLDQNKIAGHIKGTLCACLVKEEEFENAVNSPPEIQNDTAIAAASATQTSVPQEQTLTDGAAPSTNTPGISGKGPTPPLAPRSDKDEFETDAPKTGGGGVREILARSRVEECWLCNHILLLILTIYLFFYFRSDGGWKDFFWCHLVQALFFFFSTKAVCVLGDIVQERGLTIRDAVQKKKIRSFLIGVSLFSLLVAFSNAKQHACYDLSSFGIWEAIILVSFILSAFIRDCFAKTVLAITFALAVMLTMSCSKSKCDISHPESSNHSAKKHSVASQLMNTKKVVENTVVEQTANYSENKVKSLTGSKASNKKVTAGDLKSNPNVLDDCNTSVYLGELGLFERNSFVIKETAITKLEQLASWMAEQDKSKKFIITGHADQTGETFESGIPNPAGYARNMRLSKQRANAVAEWILDNENVNSEQLIVRGVGSSEPLTTDPDPEAQKMNIRVELKGNCEADTKGDQ